MKKSKESDDAHLMRTFKGVVFEGNGILLYDLKKYFFC